MIIWFFFKCTYFSLCQTEENCMETVIHCSSQNGGIGNFRIEFEQFVSEQEVSFFSQREDFSKSLAGKLSTEKYLILTFY